MDVHAVVSYVPDPHDALHGEHTLLVVAVHAVDSYVPPVHVARQLTNEDPFQYFPGLPVHDTPFQIGVDDGHVGQIVPGLHDTHFPAEHISPYAPRPFWPSPWQSVFVVHVGGLDSVHVRKSALGT